MLALPHWFNPVAWLAVRRFEEAAEWACDAAAADDSATEYARVLLQLGEAAPQPAYASSAGGRTLAARIRRVLAGPDSSRLAAEENLDRHGRPALGRRQPGAARPGGEAAERAT